VEFCPPTALAYPKRFQPGDYSIFPTELDGINGIGFQLQLWAARTLRSAIFQYASGKTDSPKAYLRHVIAFAAGKGVPLTNATVLGTLTAAETRAIVDAIRAQEGWRAGTIYTVEMGPIFYRSLLGAVPP
jgi:hypothetical protein